MSISAAIRRMLEAGLTLDQALIAAEAFEAETIVQEPVFSKRQARNRRYYERLKSSEKRLNVSETSDSDDDKTLLPPEGSSPTPLSPKPLSSLPPSPPKGGSSPTDFETFWAKYPHKVGKRDAERAFSQAIRRDSLDAIMVGLERYARKTDDRPWCNPSTFLNQDRWADAPAVVAPHRGGTSPPQQKRQKSVVDAYHEIARRKGWTDETDSFSSTDDNAQRLSSARLDGSGTTIIDLRHGADWSERSSDDGNSAAFQRRSS